MTRNGKLQMLLAMGLFPAASCHLPIHHGFAPIEAHQSDYDTTVQVRFLGVGGFVIRRGNDAVLTAPLYSNPDQEEIQGELRPKVDVISELHPPIPNVKAILVGHAHYDHLMDVPWVWARSPNATIYGNESMANILNGYTVNVQEEPVPRIPAERVRALNRGSNNVVDYRMCVQRGGPPGFVPEEAAAKGSWVSVPNSRIRVRALCSEHPPQVLKLLHLWPGRVYRPRFAPPSQSRDYQEGETLAYLIDFLSEDGTQPVFRVYYQDAPTAPRIGEVSPELLQEKAVDLALLCVGNFFDVDDPTHIVRNTSPRHIILGHWENFFEPQRDDPRGIPLANVKKAFRVIKETAGPGTEVIVPNPQAVFRFPLPPSNLATARPPREAR